jgi:hypothetical protein
MVLVVVMVLTLLSSSSILILPTRLSIHADPTIFLLQTSCFLSARLVGFHHGMFGSIPLARSNIFFVVELLAQDDLPLASVIFLPHR